MDDTIISGTSLTILERLDNLMGEESTILVDLNDKKEKSEKKKAKKEAVVDTDNKKIVEIKTEVESLETQCRKLSNALSNLRTDEFKDLINVLNLAFDPDTDLDKMNTKLPLQINKRDKKIEDLTNEVEKNKKEILECEDSISELGIRISEAIQNQKRLIELIQLSRSGDVNKTRDEVVSVLKNVGFDDNDAKTAAKLVMFPEEELIPFFKDSKLDDINDDIFKQTIDSMMNDDGSKKEKTEEPQENHEEVKEELKPEEAKEDEAVVLEEKEDTLNVLDNDEVFTDDFKLDEENAPISLDELDHTFDNPLEETAVTETSEKEETTENEKVTSDKLSEEEAKELLRGIGKTDSDIKLVDNLLSDYTKTDFEMMINTLNEYGVDLKKVPLLAYKSGITNFTANLDTLNNYGYELDGSELEKFSATLYLTLPVDFKINLETLKNYKFDLRKNNSKLALKVLAMEPKKLVENIDLLLEYGEEEFIRSDVSVLACNCKDILERILFCKANGIPYYEAKNDKVYYRAFIYDKKLLDELVEKKLDLNSVVTNKINNDNLSQIVGTEYIELLDKFYNSADYVSGDNASNDEAYFKYNSIVNQINNIFTMNGDVYVIANMLYSINNVKRNLMYLVNNSSISDKDMMMLAMLYNSHQSLEEMNQYIQMIEG